MNIKYNFQQKTLKKVIIVWLKPCSLSVETFFEGLIIMYNEKGKKQWPATETDRKFDRDNASCLMSSQKLYRQNIIVVNSSLGS